MRPALILALALGVAGATPATAAESGPTRRHSAITRPNASPSGSPPKRLACRAASRAGRRLPTSGPPSRAPRTRRPSGTSSRTAASMP